MNAKQVVNSAAAKRFNVAGSEMSFLSGPDDTNADIGLVTAVFSPGFFIPMHRHASPEIIYALDGTLEVYQQEEDGASWKSLEKHQAVTVGRNVWHALRNDSGRSLSVLAITQGDLWSFFQAIALPLGDGERPIPATPETMAALFEAASRYDYHMGSPDQNLSIGIDLGSL